MIISIYFFIFSLFASSSDGDNEEVEMPLSTLIELIRLIGIDYLSNTIYISQLQVPLLRAIISQYKLIPSLPLTSDITSWKDALIEVFSKLIINPSLSSFLLSDSDLQESILDYFDMKLSCNCNITSYLYQMLMIPAASNTLFSSNLLHNTLKLLAENEKDGIYYYYYFIYIFIL